MPAASPHRRVRHLRLACQRDEHARRARILLEDALRTATIDDTGRLIVVRRLELGSIPLRATATAWSRQLEHQLAHLRSDLVSVHSLSAPRAAAVYFSSPEEPWYLLAERTVRGLPCTDWYWPLALPSWNSRQSAGETLRHSFRTLAALPNGLPHTLHLAARLSVHRALPLLLQTLTPTDLAPLGAQLPLSTLPQQPVSELPRAHFSTHPIIPAFYLELIRTWSPGDPRTHWLALQIATTEISHSTNPPSLALSLPSAEIIARTFSRLIHVSLTQAQPSQPSPPSLSSNSSTAQPSPTTASPENKISSREPVSAETPDSTENLPLTPFTPDRVATNAGGLFFLIPLLQRAQLPAHLATLPEEMRQPYAWEIFRLALRHARIAEDDPIHQLLPSAPRPPSLTFSLSPSSYLLRAHHEARRRDTITLRDLIRRPALLSSTHTHIDLFFRPGEADLRLRRAALDVDPGWIRWLTRLISYHYTRED